MIKKIMCCCGSGLGTSMVMEMNCQKVLKKLGYKGIEVSHASLSDASADAADLFIVGGDLKSFTVGLPHVILMANMLSMAEMEEKLKKELEG